MATEEDLVVDRSKDMTIEDLREFSSIFSSEFNCSDIHDRVLCFEIIEAEEFIAKDDFKDDIESGNTICCDDIGSRLSEHEVASTREDLQHLTTNEKNVVTEMASKTEAIAIAEDPLNTEYTTDAKDEAETKRKAETANDVNEEDHASDGTPEELQCQTEEQENGEEYGKGLESNMHLSEVADNENKSILSKFFVHSQWLAVQSPYFKALFYSGMKETYSKEVIMKIYECELEAHKALIEAMYKLDALNDKDYRLVVQVLVLAHKYDVRHLIKKCKYVLLSTTPSLEMCEYILKEISHLSDIADIHEMLEKFLLKEFTPIDDTWTLEKFTSLSEAALRLLLKSDNLGTRSENTIFVALMKWVRTNISRFERKKCKLLNLVRFEFMSADFLYDVVQNDFAAKQMAGFNKYLVRGLAFHAFSERRREQFEPNLKKRTAVLADSAAPTFSWVIDEKLEEKLRTSPGNYIFSNRFWYKGYPIQLKLRFSKDLDLCGFFLMVCDLGDEACLNVFYTVKSYLFAKNASRRAEHLFTAKEPDWGFGSLERNKALTRKCFKIDVWMEIHK